MAVECRGSPWTLRRCSAKKANNNVFTSLGGRVGDCDRCYPTLPLYPAILLPSTFSPLILLLLSQLRGQHFLLSQPVPVSDTRCCCPVLLYYAAAADILQFCTVPFIGNTPSPPLLPDCPISLLPFRRTPDYPDFLTLFIAILYPREIQIIMWSQTETEKQKKTNGRRNYE